MANPATSGRGDIACAHDLTVVRHGVCNTCDAVHAVEIEYQATVTRTVSLTPNQARRIFGLGGTSDEALLERIAMITQGFPGTLNNLNPLPATADEMDLPKVTKVAGTNVADW